MVNPTPGIFLNLHFVPRDPMDIQDWCALRLALCTYLLRPSTFQLKSSKFTCNYQLGAAHVRGAPKSPDRKKGGRKLFAFQAPHEGLFALPLVVIDV